MDDALFSPDPGDPLRTPPAVAREVLGQAKNPRTYLRQIKKGVLVGGQWVRLAALRDGGSYRTTARAFRAFLAALNAPTEGDQATAGTPVPTVPRSSTRRRKASEKAAAELERQGA